MGMIANYLSFMIFGIIAGKTKRINADLVFSFEVSPMTQVVTGISFAKRLHVPHYLYVQDLWPENVITVTGINSPLVIKPIDRLVDYVYKNSNEIFATSPSFVRAICNRKSPVDEQKVHYWPQYAEEFYKPVEKTIAKRTAISYGIADDDSFKIIFTGNIGVAQGLQILPQTAKILKEENVKFVIVGDGRYLENLKVDIEKNNVQDKFVMIERQKAETIPVLLAACEAAFISFAEDELWTKTIPAKLQSYMACGMPVVAAAQGETARIIEESGCGLYCRLGDATQLSRTIVKMMRADLTEMGKKSRKYFENNFDKQVLMDEMDIWINIF